MFDIAQLKQGNIFWKISMKIPINRYYWHYGSLVTEHVDSMCQTKTAGKGGGVPGGLKGGRPSRPNRGEVCVLVFGGIPDAPE